MLYLSLAEQGIAWYLAGPDGIEPSSRVLETPILPVNYGPMITVSDLNYIVSEDLSKLYEDLLCLIRLKPI